MSKQYSLLTEGEKQMFRTSMIEATTPQQAEQVLDSITARVWWRVSKAQGTVKNEQKRVFARRQLKNYPA